MNRVSFGGQYIDRYNQVLKTEFNSRVKELDKPAGLSEIDDLTRGEFLGTIAEKSDEYKAKHDTQLHISGLKENMTEAQIKKVDQAISELEDLGFVKLLDWRAPWGRGSDIYERHDICLTNKGQEALSRFEGPRQARFSEFSASTKK